MYRWVNNKKGLDSAYLIRKAGLKRLRSAQPCFLFPKKLFMAKREKPVEVILPWKVFREIEEILGLDFDEEVKETLRKAQQDREVGDSEAYVTLEEI